MSHPLDRPIWNALTGGSSHLARGGDLALQVDPRYGPFAAARDNSPEAWAALGALEFGPVGLWVKELGPSPAPPPGAIVGGVIPCVQMVANSILGPDPDFDVVLLDDADASEMRSLAELTHPGPFGPLTHRMSSFVGVKREGRLVAMAGERMRINGFSEISAVCTHPDERGKGYGSALTRLVGRRILDRGETPYLHTQAERPWNIALYSGLGFELRAEVNVTLFVRPD